MKKIAVMLFLSLLVGIVNAGTMPVVSVSTGAATQSSHGIQASSHSHCEEGLVSVSQNDSQSVGKFSLSHYCCSSIAVLHDSITFALNKSVDFYFLGEAPKSISNIPESIYKPPKHIS